VVLVKFLHELQGLTSQNTGFFIVTAAKTSNLITIKQCFRNWICFRPQVWAEDTSLSTLENAGLNHFFPGDLECLFPFPFTWVGKQIQFPKHGVSSYIVWQTMIKIQESSNSMHYNCSVMKLLLQIECHIEIINT
jgi:hypothetical protein